MKSLLLLTLSFLLLSCTGDPLPSNLNINNASAMHKYQIEWRSNQGNPHMDIIVLRQGQEIKYSNIIDNHYDISLYQSDMITIGITYETAIDNPEIYLGIYEYIPMNLQSGVYNPNAMKLVYEQETETNAYGYNGCVQSLYK